MSTHYELRINGHLNDCWTRWFNDLTLVRDDDGTTALRGLMTDQAELHGVLAKVRDLGLELISVTPTGAPPVVEAAAHKASMATDDTEQDSPRLER